MLPLPGDRAIFPPVPKGRDSVGFMTSHQPVPCLEAGEVRRIWAKLTGAEPDSEALLAEGDAPVLTFDEFLGSMHRHSILVVIAGIYARANAVVETVRMTVSPF